MGGTNYSYKYKIKKQKMNGHIVKKGDILAKMDIEQYNLGNKTEFSKSINVISEEDGRLFWLCNDLSYVKNDSDIAIISDEDDIVDDVDKWLKELKRKERVQC